VSTEYLKLTAYFGERLRGKRGFVADELLDLFGSQRIATSVVLRGSAGFGPRHVLRSDATLTQSEDLPVAVAAVDRAERITAISEQAVAMISRGVVTLERARLLDAPLPDQAKLTLYIGRQTRVEGRPAYRAVCDVLHAHGFAGAAVFLGVDGTVAGQRRRARFFSANTDVPLMIIAAGTGEQVAAATPELTRLVPSATMTLERAQLCKRDGRLIAPPPAVPETDAAGRPLRQKLMIHTSESTVSTSTGATPIHRALVDRLREHHTVSGVTVVRGIWGFHGDHEPHGDKLIQLGRQVPVTTIVVDTPARIAAGFAVVDELTARHGLVTSELVPAFVSIDGGKRQGSTELAGPTW
jgi:PII-like signaling protein